MLLLSIKETDDEMCDIEVIEFDYIDYVMVVDAEEKDCELTVYGSG